jgi:hypothetical protein
MCTAAAAGWGGVGVGVGLMLPMVTEWQQFNFMASFMKPGVCVTCAAQQQTYVALVDGSIWKEEIGGGGEGGAMKYDTAKTTCSRNLANYAQKWKVHKQ